MMEKRKIGLFWGAVLSIAAALQVYARTRSFHGDEGFHLLAAQLALAGRKPYLDFFFQQTPLNVWWNAIWMRICGASWPTAHALAAVETSAAVLLTADYVLRRFPVPEWRLAASLTTACLVGLNALVFEFGAIGEPYALCLLMIVAAFRFAVRSVERRSPFSAGLAGIASAAAAASSLLTATVAPVLLIWMLVRNRAGSRLTKSAFFAAGALIAFTPLLLPLLQSPHRVIFDVVGFHLFYRQVGMGSLSMNLLDVATAWLNSAQALILGALAIGGWIYVRESDWDDRVRREFYLCGWLSLSIGLFVMTAHPAFPQYFVLTVPFMGILAAAGLYGTAVRSGAACPRPWPVPLVMALMVLSLGRSLHEYPGSHGWRRMESLAKLVDKVTPPGAALFADARIYFLTRRTPPAGMESRPSRKIDLPMSQAAPLHVLPQAERVRQVKAGTFSTVETCSTEEVGAFGLEQLYRQKAEIPVFGINDYCFVFWDRRNQLPARSDSP